MTRPRLGIPSLKQRADVIVNPGEFARFILIGVVATLGNMAAVSFALKSTSYGVALLVGIIAGASISFPLSKLFAFRSHDWRDARLELPRFILVYCVGVSFAWIVAMVTGNGLLLAIMPKAQAQMLGALIGASTCAVTNYLGHRFYTYSTARRLPAEK